MIRDEDLPQQSALALVQRCFKNLSAEVGNGFGPTSSGWFTERHAQKALSEDDLADLENQLERRRFDPPTVRRAQRCVEQVGTGSFSPEDTGVLIGVVRALAEQQRLFQYRLDEPLLPYSPRDPLFQSAIDCTEIRNSPRQQNLDAAAEAVVGPTLQEIGSRYLTARRGRWTAKTYATTKTKVGFLIEHLGPNRRISTISPADIRSFRDAVLRLRSNHHVGAGKSFQARQTEAGQHRIQPKTAQLIFEVSKTMFRWAKAEGYLSSNPAQDIVLDLPKAQKGKKLRRPFTAEELEKLFSAPPFTGRSSMRARLTPGKLMIQDAYFWVPVLGFYTGLRLGEIVQLHRNDVRLDGPIPYLDITEDQSGPVGTGNEKHVKSDAGVRKVPLHPDILALGFASFVAARGKLHTSKTRLFFEIGFGADGQPSSLFSKWFARLLDSVGLTDPALVFHSFRHGVEDGFRNNLTPQYVIDKIIGHADDAVSAQYGQGVSLEIMDKAVKGLELQFSVFEALKAQA